MALLFSRIKVTIAHMKLLFIMNPTSGRTSNEEVIHYIKELGMRQGFNHSIHYTTGEDDDKQLQKALSIYKPDRVAACGGDGTVQLVARNLIHSSIPMGILPLGSANGLAKALEIPKNYEEAMDLFSTSHRARPLDLLLINDKHICTHLSDIGTNAL